MAEQVYEDQGTQKASSEEDSSSSEDLDDDLEEFKLEQDNRQRRQDKELTRF